MQVISERLQSLQRLLRQIHFPPEICLLHILVTKYIKPYVAMRLQGKKRAMRTRFPSTLQKLLMEDLTLNSVNDSENGQTVLYGIGDMQLEVVASELLEKYKVEIELMRPKGSL